MTRPPVLSLALWQLTQYCVRTAEAAVDEGDVRGGAVVA
jgi:hypothetical protein